MPSSSSLIAESLSLELLTRTRSISYAEEGHLHLFKLGVEHFLANLHLKLVLGASALEATRLLVLVLLLVADLRFHHVADPVQQDVKQIASLPVLENLLT